MKKEKLRKGDTNELQNHEKYLMFTHIYLKKITQFDKKVTALYPYRIIPDCKLQIAKASSIRNRQVS